MRANKYARYTIKMHMLVSCPRLSRQVTIAAGTLLTHCGSSSIIFLIIYKEVVPLKTTVKELDYDAVMALPRPEAKNPIKPNFFFKGLMRTLSEFGLMSSQFTYTTRGLDAVPMDQPCLILMNHSCFLDLMMVSKIFYPRPYNIVCTSDGFVGKEMLMRRVGCIPTKKFVTDLSLVRDMEYCFKELGSSVLMYPEASYSFDGTTTPLPRKMGVLLKKFGVPVIMVKTTGAFTRNPLYNELQVRKSVPIHADAYVLYTREDIQNMTVRELSDGLDEAFAYDHFRWQKDNGVLVEDSFRADGLNRILYKCASCGEEGKTEGKETKLRCTACGKTYTLTPLGELEAEDGSAEFTQIPDWYAWQRQQVRTQIEEGTYRLDADVDIAMMVDYKAIYRVGEGRLTHDNTGFTLTGCGGRLHYTQKPQSCYGLYADYYWYELGDIICIGTNDTLYYCFPRGTDVVARTRLAAEEMYKLYKQRPIRTSAGI